MLFRKVSALASTILALNSTMSTKTDEYIKIKVEDTNQDKTIETSAPSTPDIVVRVGEYQGKPGKRVYLTSEQLHTLNIPDDIPVYTDNNGFFISEFDINLKLSKAIYKELVTRGIDVNLQIAKDKSEDLNQAGRIAKATGAKMYLSVHHDYYAEDTEGYTFITNPGNDYDYQLAQELSNSIKGGLVKQRACRIQDNYIGEMNHTDSMINILGEFGFFSNLEELEKIMSDEQVNYVAKQIAEELEIILK